MKLGVTGTRHGLTILQQGAAAGELHRLRLTGFDELHHGDCRGVDAELAEIARVEGYRLVCHPPSNDRLRAFVVSEEMRAAKEYLVRNRDIVDEADMMLACPDGPRKPRSGT